MIQTLYDTGSDKLVTSKMDGAVYDIACGGDCVCGGVGDEFTLNYNASSLDVTFNSGSQAIIGGGFFKVTEIESVTLPESSTIYLCARIDNSKASGSTGSIVSLTQSQMKSENLNGGGTVRDMLLYIVETSASGVTQVTNKKVIKTNSATGDLDTRISALETKVGNYSLWVGTQTEYDAITTKDANTIYHILES